MLYRLYCFIALLQFCSAFFIYVAIINGLARPIVDVQYHYPDIVGNRLFDRRYNDMDINDKIGLQCHILSAW